MLHQNAFSLGPPYVRTDVFCIYHITLIKISQNLSIISKNLDTLLTKYHNAVLIEYFIADKKGASLKDFCQSKSKHLIKVCTCFKTQIIPRSYIPC